MAAPASSWPGLLGAAEHRSAHCPSLPLHPDPPWASVGRQAGKQGNGQAWGDSGWGPIDIALRAAPGRTLCGPASGRAAPPLLCVPMEKKVGTGCRFPFPLILRGGQGPLAKEVMKRRASSPLTEKNLDTPCPSNYRLPTEGCYPKGLSLFSGDN